MLGYDDALDAFGIHGVGGIVGALLTGVFAAEAIGGRAGVLEGNPGQFLTAGLRRARHDRLVRRRSRSSCSS